MNISIMLPTRGRPVGLYKSVKSVLDTAKNPRDLEFLFRTDQDDKSALEQIGGLIIDAGATAQEIRGPRVGYSRVFEMYNEMSLKACGRYVLLWNDDAEMATRHWDELLTRDVSRPLVQCLRRSTLQSADNTLPFINKLIVDVLGGVSKHTYTDTWIGDVAQMAGVLVFRNDVVFTHHHPMNDATHFEGLEDLRRSGQHESYKARIRERVEEAEKIKKLLEAML